MVSRRLLGAARITYPVLGWYVLRHVQRVIGVRFGDIVRLTSMATCRSPPFPPVSMRDACLHAFYQ